MHQKRQRITSQNISESTPAFIRMNSNNITIVYITKCSIEHVHAIYIFHTELITNMLLFEKYNSTDKIRKLKICTTSSSKQFELHSRKCIKVHVLAPMNNCPALNTRAYPHILDQLTGKIGKITKQAPILKLINMNLASTTSSTPLF